MGKYIPLFYIHNRNQGEGDETRPLGKAFPFEPFQLDGMETGGPS
jgi:hypothetical protein